MQVYPESGRQSDPQPGWFPLSHCYVEARTPSPQVEEQVDGWPTLPEQVYPESEIQSDPHPDWFPLSHC